MPGRRNTASIHARALAISPPFDVQLDAGAEENEAQRDGENEIQRRNGPEYEGLAEIFRGFDWERYLPHHQRRQNGEQHDARTVEETLTHAAGCLVFDYTDMKGGFR